LEAALPGLPSPGVCGGVDWPSFFDRADAHGVTPLIADRWQALGVLDRVPSQARERLLTAYRDNAERNAHVRREVIEYWQVIANAGVPAILLKGWPLVETLYESPALRLITDVDVLIPADQAQATLRALAAAGLEPLPRNRDAWVEKHLPAYWRLDGRVVTYPLANMFDPQHPRSVEAHVRVWEANFRGLRLGEPAGLWERSRIVDVAGQPMRILSLADTLVHLCVHWACHWIEREARLNQLVDLDRFVRKFGARVDWEQVLEIGRAARVARFVFAAIEVVRLTLGTPLPPPAPLDDLRAECPAGLRRWIERQAADDVRSMNPRRPDKSRAYRLTWLSAQSIAERAGIVRYALLPPREFIMGRYGLKRRWQAIPFYIPYVLSRALGMLQPFAQRIMRTARPVEQT
jgi:hypothetical protein